MVIAGAVSPMVVSGGFPVSALFGRLTTAFPAVTAAFPVFGISQAPVLPATRPASYANVIDTISSIE